MIRALDLGRQRVPGRPGLRLPPTTPAPGSSSPAGPSRSTTCRSSPGPRSATSTGCPARRSSAARRRSTCTASTRPARRCRGFPKLTADWTVANPALGSLGTFDVDAAARKVVIGLTRTGTLLAYDTDAPSCSPGSWPRFHHDNANSGDYSRDAALPGKPYDIARRPATRITFKAPGDDLHVRHGRPLRGRAVERHDHGRELREPGAGRRARPRPRRPARRSRMQIPPERRRFVAIRGGGRAGQRGTARGHRGPELRAAAGRHARARARSCPPSARARRRTARTGRRSRSRPAPAASRSRRS